MRGVISPSPRTALRVGQVGLLLLLLGACAGRQSVLPSAPRPIFVGYEEMGDASWYGPPYHGRRAASGEVYNMHQMTAAHRTLPFGTWVAVENLQNGRATEVRINDRGPFVDGRILDLSHAAARLLGGLGPGVIPVRMRVFALPGARAAPSGGVFSVQVGSFILEHRALALKGELERKWMGAFVRRAEVGGQAFYRVRLGRFGSRAEAEQVARQLAAAGHAVLVTDD